MRGGTTTGQRLLSGETVAQARARSGLQRAALITSRVAPLVPPLAITLTALASYAWVAIHVTTPPPPNSNFPPQVTSWERLAHWDGGWYRTIAQFGYTSPRFGAFFPLFPFLAAAAHALVPSVHIVKEGIAINVIATCAAMIIVDRALYRLHWPAWQRWLSVALLVTLPGAYFDTAFYSDALLLLAMALVVYGILVPDSIQWVVAGVILGTLDRPLGVLLVLGLAVVLLPRLRTQPVQTVGTIALALFGVLPVLILFWRVYGNPLQFVVAAGTWNNHILAMGFRNTLHDLHVEMFLLTNYHTPTAIGLWSVVAGVPLVALAWRWRPAFGVLSVAFVVTGVLMGGIDSQSRFLMVILPLWIGALGALRRWWYTWIGVSAAVAVGFLINLQLVDDFARWVFAG